MAMLVLLGAASLAKAQIVVSQTTVSTTRVYEKSGREKGFVIRPELGTGFSIMYKGGFMVEPTLTGVYQFNPYFSIGAGFGVTHIMNDNSGMTAIPVYANLRAYFCDRKWSPFFDLKVGFNFPVKEYQKTDYYYGGSYSIDGVSVEGSMIQGTLGMQYKHFDFGFTYGMFNHYDKYYHYDNYGQLEYSDFHSTFGIKLLLSVAYNFQL